MPEAFTYYDMQRRIAAQVGSGLYTLEFHKEYMAKEWTRTLKNAELLKDLGSFEFSGIFSFKIFIFKTNK
jgi:hypothetical protein